MNVLIKINNEMTREQWLSHRARLGIGGSDVSVLFGVNKFRSIFDLWLEKTGQKKPEESTSEAAHFGTLLEETVKREFMARTGLKVRAKNAILQHEEYPWCIANLDGVINEDGEPVIFEAKTAIEYKSSDWEKGVPFEYMLQVNHYFAVTGYRKAYVAALVGGNKFYIHTLYRDEELIAEIIRREKEFWQVNVLGRVEPVADGSKATTEFLNSKYSDSNGSVIQLSDDTIPIFEKYESVNKQLEELKAEKEGLANQLKQVLGENETGYIHDYKVSWSKVTQNRLDQKRLKEEQPDIYDEYRRESSYRKLQIA